MHNKQTLQRIIGFVILMLVVTACEGLAGEPEIVQTVQLATAIPETLDVPVSLNRGATIYAENCVRCHGIGGAGDGALVLSGDVQNVPDFTDPATIQDTSLQEWFDVITNGNLEAVMPPWKDALSAQDRWAVALYTYTLSYDATALEQGQTIYEAQCATCHAIDGSGTADGSSLLGLVDYTEAELFPLLTSHLTELEATSAIPEDSLDEVVQYMRMLSSQEQTLPSDTSDTIEQEAPPPASTEEASEEASAESTPASASTPVEIPQSTGIIRGQITQGTTGGDSVEGLEAVVHIYDSQLFEQVAEYTVGAEGTFQYDEVVIRQDFAYRVSVVYKGISYSSPIRIGNPDETEMVIDVTVYEPGATASDIVITSRATQVNLSSQGLYIIEVIEMTNTSDRAFMREDIPGVPEPASVAFAIPEGAELQLQHTDPNRIILSDDGQVVLDGAAVLPGSEHYIQFGYTLPVENAQNIQQPIEYAVDGPIAFFVENSHLSFEADGFELTRTQPFNDQMYDIFQLMSQPSPGDVLTYNISLDSTRTGESSAIVPNEVLALVLVVVGVVLVGSAGFLIWRGRQNNASNEEGVDENATSAALIEQIAALDNAFKAGEIDKKTYQNKRDELKARLMVLMQAEQSEN